MNLENITTHGCLVPRSPGGCPPVETVPDVLGLRVSPDTSQVEVAGKIPYFARLVLSNGQERDVTELATWTTSDTTIANIDNTGLATGQSIGTTTVQASYQGLIDFAQINVVKGCETAGLDIVLVFDRSAGMGDTALDGKSMLDRCKSSARALVENAIWGKDKIAVVSCAGTYDDNPLATHHYAADATLHLVLSAVKDDVMAAIDSIHMGNCYQQQGQNYITQCATGTGAGLQKALEELTSPRHRPAARPMVVYIGLAYEVFAQPDPLAVSPQLQAINAATAALVVGKPVYHYPPSSVRPLGRMSTWEYAQLWVTCNLFWGVENPDDLPTAMADVLFAICEEQFTGCLYYFAPSGDPPPVVRYRDQLDYTGWINWNVIQGFVDLIGIDLWPVLPGHGMYMDLVGTDLEHRTGKNAVGAVESKQLFNFGSGRYRLAFSLAGNQRSAKGDFSVQVKVGTLLDKIITISDWDQPLTRYTFDFSTSAPVAATVVFRHLPLPENVPSTVGCILDDVNLTNLDTGLVMLNDTFDSENP